MSVKTKQKIRIWYDAHIGRIVPRYAVVSVICCFLFNSLVYTGTQLMMAEERHYDLSLQFDKDLPFVPEWVYIYLVCFLFWAVNYILITREGREAWFRFAVGDYLSRVICGVFFVLMPTTNERPEVVADGLTGVLINFVYNMDAPTNLFPSIHCLVSWFCYIGLRKSEKVPSWYKVFSCVFAVLVFASTQFTKQHYILDVFSAVVIAEFCFWLGHKGEWYRHAERFFGRVNKLIFGEAWEDESI